MKEPIFISLFLLYFLKICVSFIFVHQNKDKNKNKKWNKFGVPVTHRDVPTHPNTSLPALAHHSPPTRAQQACVTMTNSTLPTHSNTAGLYDKWKSQFDIADDGAQAGRQTCRGGAGRQAGTDRQADRQVQAGRYRQTGRSSED